MSERLTFSIKGWQEEQQRFGYSSLVSEKELKRLEGLCRKQSEGWLLVMPLRRRTEVVNWSPIQIVERPTSLSV